jgi:hypothetical protein
MKGRNLPLRLRRRKAGSNMASLEGGAVARRTVAKIPGTGSIKLGRTIRFSGLRK